MKHHVILLTDSLVIPGSYITEEWNNGNDKDNEIPFQDLVENINKETLEEVKASLSFFAFVKREFCPPATPEAIAAGIGRPIISDEELLKTIGGSASLVEIVLAGTAIISMFFFKANGLPKYQKVFELQLPEE